MNVFERGVQSCSLYKLFQERNEIVLLLGSNL